MTTETDWQRITKAEQDGTQLVVLEPNLSGSRIAVLPDLHIPHHDKVLVRKALNLVQGYEYIVLIGDLIDAYSVSSFDKNPRRKETLQDELSEAHEFLDTLRLENPTADIRLCEGNHEDRLRRFLWGKAPEIATLKGMSMPELLRLEEYDIAYYGKDGFKLHGVRFKHGELVRSGSGATARAEMTAHRCNGVSGHTHRLGKAVTVDKEGIRSEWWEAGHLCDTSASEYVVSPDWQPGMLLGRVVDGVARFDAVEF